MYLLCIWSIYIYVCVCVCIYSIYLPQMSFPHSRLGSQALLESPASRGLSVAPSRLPLLSALASGGTVAADAPVPQRAGAVGRRCRKIYEA